MAADQFAPPVPTHSAGRLLIVSSFFPPASVGGAEIVAFRHAKMMQRDGWETMVFAGDFFTEKRLQWRSREQTGVFEGLRIVRIRSRLRPSREFYNPAMAKHFAAALREFAPNVVHFHDFRGLGANLLPLARASGAKTVVTLHDRWGICFKATLLRNDFSSCRDFEGCSQCARQLRTPSGRLPIRLRRDYVMTNLARADALIAPSRQLAADFIRAGIAPGRIQHVSSGIDLGKIPPRTRKAGEQCAFLCPAYLGKHKGIKQLAEAAKILLQDEDLRGRWSLDIAGDGYLEG